MIPTRNSPQYGSFLLLFLSRVELPELSTTSPTIVLSRRPQPTTISLNLILVCVAHRWDLLSLFCVTVSFLASHLRLENANEATLASSYGLRDHACDYRVGYLPFPVVKHRYENGVEEDEEDICPGSMIR